MIKTNLALKHCMLSLTFIALLSIGTAPNAHSAATVDATSYKVINKVTVGGEGGWDYLSVDPAGRRLYISRGTHLMVLDADSITQVGDIPDTPGVHGAAIAADLGRGYTSNGGNNTVTIFDLKTLKTLGQVSVGNRPDAFLYDSVTKRVFTFNGGSDDATAIDAVSGKVVGTVALGGKPEFPTTDGKGNVYVNIEDKSEIVHFDAKTLAVKKRWSVTPGEEPSGMAIDAKNHRLFSVCGNGMMVVSDADAGKVIATPAIGNHPDAAGFDPGTGLAFSSNGDGTLTIVKEESPSKFTVVSTVTTEPGARTMTLDTKTHNVYLVTAKPQAPAPGEETQGRRRRSYEPGSFTVLVVGPSK